MGRVQWFVDLLWRSDVIGFRRERFQKTPKSSRQDWKRTKSSYSTVDMSLVEVEVNNECSCANDKWKMTITRIMQPFLRNSRDETAIG
ncbi:hypothetical protein AVEN_224963-1 [Araneus ventricosus]|uniref:Uncharacterized protein n=1 Tax=Araneus ventricosus TaxID=182803 RepID=A0A4Y2PES3_ARAVE|nr:hypothetical protein AVEN_66619-1 [Araneus ventricosus]GBN49469.1 hypothetical protein AVEN_224963-1 [Araneus ventricosus]